jgi:hypothetical protein
VALALVVEEQGAHLLQLRLPRRYLSMQQESPKGICFVQFERYDFNRFELCAQRQWGAMMIAAPPAVMCIGQGSSGMCGRWVVLMGAWRGGLQQRPVYDQYINRC